jgi:transcription initiation factor TFIID subunit 5
MPHAQRQAVVDLDTDIVAQVIEYLVKKGYNRTEQMLRLESSKLDREGRPIQERVEDTGTEKYATAYKLLDNWIKQNLGFYKVSIVALIVTNYR